MKTEKDIILKSPNNTYPLDEIIRKEPYYTTVHLIVAPTETFSPKPFLREVSTTTNLIDLIRLKRSACPSYLEAVPFDQIDLDPVFQNKLQFYGQTDEVIIHLDQPSYQKLPNLNKDQNKHDRYGKASSFDHVQVKRLTNDKIGHGGNYHARYRYKIKIKFSQPQLEFIIKTLFYNVRVESYIYDTKIDSPTPEVYKDTMHMPVNLKIESDVDGFKQRAEELLILCTNLNTLQIVNPLQFDTIPMTRYTMHNVYCESITGTQWKLLSLHTKDSHTFIQRYSNLAIVRVER